MGCSQLIKFKTKKGQMNSIDITLALLIFVFLLVFIITFWFVTTIEIENTIKKNKMEAAAVSISDLLIKTQGLPNNWEENANNTQMLGLATYSQNVLDENKLANFTNLTYENAKELLGVDYEFYFYIEDLEKNRLYATGNSTFQEQIVSITRFGILNEEKVIMRVMVHG